MRANEVVGILSAGTEGTVVGLLNAPHLNGLHGQIIKYDAVTGRYKIQCDNDQNVALKPENFKIEPGFATTEDGVVIGDAPAGNPAPNPSSSMGSAGMGNATNPPLRISINQQYQPPNRPSLQPPPPEGFIRGSFLYQQFPKMSIMSTAGTVWLTLIVCLLIYPPRGYT